MHKLFLSYSPQDKPFARSLELGLQELGFEIWMDIHDMLPGTAIIDQVHLALRESMAVIVLISEHSLRSQWIPFEMGAATAYGKQIIPIHLSPESIAIPPYLSQYVLLDAAHVTLREIVKKIGEAVEYLPVKKGIGSGKVVEKLETSAERASVMTKTEVKHKPNPAFMRPWMPSPALGAVVGMKPMARTEVTKKLWEYIKKNKLQDTTNRRMINADDKLQEVFGGKKQVSMFEMTKLVSKHLSKS